MRYSDKIQASLLSFFFTRSYSSKKQNICVCVSVFPTFSTGPKKKIDLKYKPSRDIVPWYMRGCSTVQVLHPF